VGSSVQINQAFVLLLSHRARLFVEMISAELKGNEMQTIFFFYLLYSNLISKWIRNYPINHVFYGTQDILKND